MNTGLVQVAAKVESSFASATCTNKKRDRRPGSIRTQHGLGGAIAAGLLAAPLMSGCVIAIGGGGDDGDAHWGASTGHSGRYETLLGADVNARAGEVVITTSSNGCTRDSSFRTDVDRDGGVYRIGFRRTEADLCKALMPDGVRLAWTYAQLGVPDGARVSLINPVGR